MDFSIIEVDENMSIAEDIVAKEFGRDPKVNGYAIFNPDGSLIANKKLKKDFVESLGIGITTMGDGLDSGFLQLGDERLLILKTEIAIIVVSFAMTVQIGFIVMMINKIRSQVLQSAAGTQPSKPATPAAIKPAVTPVASKSGGDDEAIADFKAMGVPPPPSGAKISSVIGKPLKQDAQEGANIPPPPSSAKVETLSASTPEKPSKVEASVGESLSKVTTDMEKVTASSETPPAVFIPTAKAQVEAPEPPTSPQPEKPVSVEAEISYEDALNKIPGPTDKFANLWDEYTRSELNKNFGEIALEVLSQVDGISRLSTISSRLPHLAGTQIFEVMKAAMNEGYIIFSSSAAL